jgi:hypothetical protein
VNNVCHPRLGFMPMPMQQGDFVASCQLTGLGVVELIGFLIGAVVALIVILVLFGLLLNAAGYQPDPNRQRAKPSPS